MTGGGAANIVDVVDEILSHEPNAAGLAINWQLFGSNGQKKADYSRGVLERFTRRAPSDWSTQVPLGYQGGNIHVKVLTNPREINFIDQPHYPIYFEECYSVNECGKFVKDHDNNPVTADKIVVNHYYTKSLEEFTLKQNRGRSDSAAKYADEWFDTYNRNDEFDDGILKYRAARAENFSLEDDSQKFRRVIDALVETLSTFAAEESSPGKLETALTCRALSTYLREKFPDIERMKIYEEVSLIAILRSLGVMTLADAQLLIRELPELLTLPYPAAKDLRNVILQIIPQMMEVSHLKVMWRDYVELDYIRGLLKLIKE